MTDQEKEKKDLLNKLKKGWTLHLWRNTTPHNIWLESPKGKSDYHLDVREDRGLFMWLREHCSLRRKEGVVQYPASYARMFRPADNGLAAEEIWEYDESKDDKSKSA